MDYKELDDFLQKIAEQRNLLAATDYSDDSYDDLEEELHDLEDDFLDEFGEAFEDILQDVHDEFCPDSDVLSPIAYLAKVYSTKVDEETGEVSFGAGKQEGVIVEVEEYDAKLVRMVLVPGPPRLILNISGVGAREVWRGE